MLNQRYLLGLAAIAAMFIATALQVNQLFKDHAEHGEIVNTAGAQRMASQRVALLAQRLSVAQSKIEISAERAKLRIVLDRMRAGFVRLTQGEEPPAYGTPALRQWYSAEGGDLLRRVPEFIARGEAVYSDPAQARPHALWLAGAADGLLGDLDRAVSLYQDKVREHQANDERVHAGFVALSLVALLALGLFLFRPMARQAALAFEDIDLALRDRTQFLSQALRISKMGYWRLLDANPNQIWVSQELISMQGWSLKEGHVPISALAASGDADGAKRQLEMVAAVRGDGQTRELRLQGLRGDGSAVDLHLIFYALRDLRGDVIGVCGIQRDVSDEVAIQRVAEARRRDLDEAQRLGRIATWRWRIGADCVDASADLLAMLGRCSQTFAPTVAAIQGLYAPPDLKIIDRQFKALIAGGDSFEVCVQARHAKGHYLDLVMRAKAERNDDGALVALFGSVQDVTAEKVIERQLLARDRDLSEAQTLGKMAPWRYVLADRRMEWTDQTFALLGVSSETFKPSIETCRGLYLGDGNIRLRDMLSGLLQQHDAPPAEIQVQGANGVVRDMVVRAKLEVDATGAPVSIFGTFQDVTEVKTAERELEQLAYFDHLTGLANRALFKRELKKACDRAQIDGRGRQIILLDLDQFKDVNDSLGHAAGDELLAVVAKRLSAHAAQDHLIARLGGDEFAILISDPEALDVMAFCNALVSVLCEPATLERGEVSVGASLGVVSIPQDAADPEEVMRCADLALYAAKEAGRRRAMRFHPSLSESMQARLSLAREIRAGLRANQFVPHFQPVVDVRTNRVAGFEALLRWPHPTRGTVSPSEFVPIAESSHLIAELGAYVLNSACSAAQGWVTAGIGPREVAINVSTAQVWHGDLEAAIDHALRVSGLDPRLLCIEVTESVFAADALSRLEGILNRLKARGVTLALDDFGTGYSSLGYLNRLPFDKLKIDRTFVTGSDVSDSKRRLLRGIVELGHGLGMKVVAEGVETEGELKTACDLGCDLVQGWYFAKAMPDAQAVAEAARIEALAMLVPFRRAPVEGQRQTG